MNEKLSPDIKFETADKILKIKKKIYLVLWKKIIQIATYLDDEI